MALLALYANLDLANTFTEDQTINGVTFGAGPDAGVDNIIAGQGALASNASGAREIAIGKDALKSLASGNGNIALGKAVAELLAAGAGNVFVGDQLAPVLTSGGSNTAIGFQALATATSAGLNTAVGALALRRLTSGTRNVAVGYDAGVDSGSPVLDRTTTVGDGCQATKSNQAVFGGPLTTETLLRGNIALESKTITDIGTTGAQTINKTSGSVVFAGAATSLVVTNSFAVAPSSGAVGSIIVVSIRTADATAVLGSVVCSANGSFTINMKVAPTGATRVDFVLFN